MKASVADHKYLTYCIRIVTARDGTYYFHAGNSDLVMGGNTYLGIGQVFSNYTTGVDLKAAVVDYEGFLSVAGVTRADIEKGVFNNARAYLFATTWNNPVEDEEPLFSSIFGNAQLQDGKYVFEEIALMDTLKQRVGRSVTALCPWEFGSSRCGVNLATYTVNGSVTAVDNAYTFYDLDSTSIQADGFFNYGKITFTSGENRKGKSYQIKSYAAGKFILFDDPVGEIAVGDTFTAIAGCQKRFNEDCVGKFSNGANFGGFPHIPTNMQANTVGNLR